MTTAIEDLREGQMVDAMFFGRWHPAKVVKVARTLVTVDVLLPHGVKHVRRAHLSASLIRPRPPQPPPAQTEEA